MAKRVDANQAEIVAAPSKIAITIYGVPIPKQSFRYKKNGGYLNPHIKAWQETVSIIAMMGARENGWMITSLPLSVELNFWLPDKRRRDLDNLM